MGARGRASDIPALVRELAARPEYQLADGSPNKSLIARTCEITRTRVQTILREPPPADDPTVS